ncbi:hypothetical protein GCM10007962_19990 [Yeosuana aromativorans]|uniref:GW domain-containing protein n=1 Tax=Yeosuana aromativorans TaxID=288019 RepID=A0A8J3FGQ6_9FLAO|nr:GW dipeptide domain-containing protein [Yeosuana aromativorans]GGK25725.1 hypothetical protein GCM10007962_19990 [Yeosuana aromativorans]
MKIKVLVTVLIASVFIGCKNEPKVVPITSSPDGSSDPSGVFSAPGSSDSGQAMTNELHSVVVKEVLPTSKYVYLHVTEGDETYWVATRKMEAKVGETYYFKGGLLKTNFESKEYNRVFDKVYLVGALVPAVHGGNAVSQSTTDYGNAKPSEVQKEDIPMHTEKVVQHQGSMKIAELVNNPKKYEGKTVQIDGICTKINAGIMDRNWIHVKDGSKDDFDLVVTSDAFVPEGAAFTIKAVVTLDKDFGAGYKYDIILENGVLVK